jgi:centromere/kinetochore protein ZW10
LYFNCCSLFKGYCFLWSQVVPEDASKLADFQKIIERTSQFEAALKELNFVSSSDAESRLSKYAEDVEVHFASRKKIEILAKARNLLLQCNFTIPQDIAMRNAKHIVCLLFSSERCVVSEAASQLMNLVHKTLEVALFRLLQFNISFFQTRLG